MIIKLSMNESLVYFKQAIQNEDFFPDFLQLE